MKKIAAYILTLAVIVFAGCKDKTTINQDEAGKVITAYLKANPEYKIGFFKFGELKVSSTNDKAEFGYYKTLESKGLITIILKEAKKKFLSKDSNYVYLVKLNEKASPLVLKQSGDKATVKTVEYLLSDEKPVNFSIVNSNTAKVTVSLKKINTDFSPFDKEVNENSDFITKTYKLKLDKNEGWKVQK